MPRWVYIYYDRKEIRRKSSKIGCCEVHVCLSNIIYLSLSQLKKEEEACVLVLDEISMGFVVCAWMWTKAQVVGEEKRHGKRRRLVGLTATVTKAVTEPWIDKNWKLEDWIDKIES